MSSQSTFDLQLSAEQIEQFHRDGFLSIDRITTDEELEWMRGLYDQIFENRSGEDKGQYFDLGGPKGHKGPEVLPQVLRPEERFPDLLETTYYRNARKVAEVLLGVDDSAVVPFGHMILKPAGYGRETPWHQDEAYNPNVENDANNVSVWMPLEDASVESGCMQFIPGSHLEGGVREHYHLDHDPTVHGLMTDDVEPSGAVAIPLKAGGASVHHCRTMHYAGPNTTERPRRAFIWVMSTPGTPREAPDERPWIEEGKRAVEKLRAEGKLPPLKG